MIKHIKIVLIISFTFICLLSFGHGGKNRSKKKNNTAIETKKDHQESGNETQKPSKDHQESTDKSQKPSKDHQESGNETQTSSKNHHEPTNRSKKASKSHHESSDHPKELQADFDDFPTLHPLIVHFPIVLLLLALFSQLAGFFVFKNELSWITLFLLAGGFVGAYTAGNFVHPDTDGLSDYLEKILEQHETYADYTIWLSGIALLFKAASHFVFKRKLWAEMVVAVILIGSAYTVSTAGHYGAQLIHIEGVGAKGEYLETDKNGHQH